MNQIQDFFSQLSSKDLPTGGALLVAIVLLFLVFKTGKAISRFLLFVIAVGLLAGAWWWHHHK